MKLVSPPSFHPLYVMLRLEDFHCSLAMSGLNYSKANAKLLASPEALSHVSTAYRLVNARLSGDEALSDRAIAVVITLTIFEMLQGNHQRSLVHFKGLRQMVYLRGGVSQLAHNRTVLQKMWK